MAYPHYMIEVPMDAHSVSTAAPTTAISVIPYTRAISLNATFIGVTNAGLGSWQPMCMPHKIHRVGVKVLALANPQEIMFYKRIEGGATTWATDIGNPTGVLFRMMLPTTCVTGKVAYKDVTGSYIIRPGEQLIVSASTAVDTVARISLLVSPVPEQPANVTSMVGVTA